MLSNSIDSFWLDPLEQFETHSLSCAFQSTTGLILTLVFMLLFTFTFCGFFGHQGELNKKSNFLFTKLLLVKGLVDLVDENLNITKCIFFPPIFYTFLIAAIGNLLGMIPYSFTLTSCAIVTFFISATFFLGTTFIGIYMHGFGFFRLFLPPGVPAEIAFFLVAIETISYVARLFSLAIRLFANMLSGHGLLKILGAFTLNFLLRAGGAETVVLLFPLLIVFIVTLLEIAIAFTQAYVLIILICIYLNDVINLH